MSSSAFGGGGKVLTLLPDEQPATSHLEALQRQGLVDCSQIDDKGSHWHFTSLGAERIQHYRTMTSPEPVLKVRTSLLRFGSFLPDYATVDGR